MSFIQKNNITQENKIQKNFSIKGFIFNILKIGFLFLPLTPSVLGITFIKEEVMNKSKFRTTFLCVGIFLITVTLGGFWYPFPFAKKHLSDFQ
ncbi:putative membrane protein [Candidatus Phytoplasma solani]|uniref:hypothetical protein n=1 Tax=Candidatus Phytoplasma solani TaxID=69896 RepID=UPI0032DAF244